MGLRKSNTPDPLREVVDRGFPRHVDGLVAQLRGGDAEQRRWAVRDLTSHPQAAAALGAQLLVEVSPRDIFPNCPRYIPELELKAPSPYVPQADAAPLEPAWKSFSIFSDVVPPRR